MQETTKLAFTVEAGLYRLGIKRHKVHVSIHRLCNLAAQFILLPTCTHKRDSTNTFSAYWANHLHNPCAHNGDTLLLYMESAGMRPNSYFKLQLSMLSGKYISRRQDISSNDSQKVSQILC